MTGDSPFFPLQVFTFHHFSFLLMYPLSPLLVIISVRGREREMLGVFSGEMVEAPTELVAVGSRTLSPKTRGTELVA